MIGLAACTRQIECSVMGWVNQFPMGTEAELLSGILECMDACVCNFFSLACGSYSISSTQRHPH